jgi:hypothetical protein
VNRAPRSAAVAALLLFIVASPASAQGTGLRQFGVWLDDATVAPPGQGWATFGVGYARASFGSQWDAPSIDLGIGMPPRIQIALSAPVTRVDYTDGTTTRSMGDAYGSVKMTLLDPTEEGRSFGLAIVPVVEFLGSDSVLEGAGRTYWALPVAIEKRFESFRAYGSVGYFSRGSAFVAGAAEVPASEKVTVTATLSYARSLEDDPLSDAEGLARNRWDLSGGAVYFFNSKATFYASLGRTISHHDANASSFAFGAGVSFGFQHRIGGPEKTAKAASGRATPRRP